MFANWPLDPLVLAGLIGGAFLYLRAAGRVRSTRGVRAFAPSRSWFFASGLVVIFVALQSPLDAAVSTSFSAHMVQHLLLTMVAAPLLVLGAPVTLALLSSSRPTRKRLLSLLRSRPVRVVSNPAVAWSLFIAVLWATHLTSLYEMSLENAGVHALEHLAYLVAALLFWLPVVGIEPSPSGLSHPARILYLFLAMPPMAFLGLALVSANHVLYPAYAVAEGLRRALSDQAAAGAIMWTGTMFLIVPALALVLLDWMRADEKEASRIDARLARASERALAADGA
jgi:putative membrane protein